MIAIQAPGVEITEIDLSFYDFPAPREETTNVYVTGFASKGLNYVPYKFTSDNTEKDITDTFGTPENEAERYFYNACIEVIKRPRAVLYASKLPYCNTSMSSIVGAEYALSSIGSISADYRYFLGYVEGEHTSTDDLLISAEINLFGRLNSKKAYYKTDFEQFATLSSSELSDADHVLSTVVDFDSYGVKDVTTTFNNKITGSWVLDETAPGELSAWKDIAYDFKLDSAVTLADGKIITPCYYRAKYGGVWGNKFGEIYSEDNTIKTAVKIDFDKIGLYSLEKVEQYRTGERKPALNKFVIFDKTQAQYDEVPVDKFHKGNNQQLIGIVPVVTTAANALYFQKMIDVDEDDADQIANYEAMGNIVTTKMSADVKPLSAVIGKRQNEGTALSADYIENPFIYAENVLNTSTGVVEPKIYNNLLVTGTNSNFYQADNKTADTMSKTAASSFPWIGKNNVGDFDREYMKHIGVVVFKGYLDAEEGNKVNYKPVEAFAGTLKPGVLNSVTGKSMFIDEVVNTNSKFIEFYSNCFNSDDNNFYTWDDAVQDKSQSEQEADADPCKSLVFRTVNPNATTESIVEGTEEKINASTHDKGTGDAVNLNGVEDPTNKGTYTRPGQMNGVKYDDIDILVVNRMDAPVFGFKKFECIKIINVTESISKSLDKCFEKMKDINAKQIDLVLDAGVSNIAQFYTTCNCPTGIFFMDEDDPDKGWYSILNAEDVNLGRAKRYKVALNYNPTSPTAVKNWQLTDYAHTKKWQMILLKYDNFCKNMRKDCMFIADGLRPLCLKGNSKLVRPTSYTATINNTIAPKMKYMAGAVDTSYGAGYCDWMQKEDEFTGLNFWLPPSIKAAGIYIDTTNNAHYWDAPAGVNRGVLDVKDVAFSPTVYEAANFYTKSWNYCTYYEIEGNVLEGQRTFQTRPTAFDRVNVRRLFLNLERKVFLMGRKFLYEGNTAYNRQRFVDAVTPYFEDAKINGGCYDYRIICDDTNNTSDTIDRNELHIKIGIKPTKTIEFIDATFVCLRTGGSWTEAGF